MGAIITTFNLIRENDFKLSPALYHQTNIKNNNLVPLDKLLYRELKRSDLGQEVGSNNYVTDSEFFFIKTKALKANSFLPDINAESVTPVTPQSFVNHNLKAGDIILSKDSNIGETVILDKDYPRYMLSGALYKLPVIERHKYYIIAFIKHRYFRAQLDYLVPKGATIRHAGTKFLKCLIPFPETNTTEIEDYISLLTRRIIELEIEIKKRNDEINQLINTELEQLQLPDNKYQYTDATYNSVMTNNRLDTGLYTEDFQKAAFLIRNYTDGVFYIDPKKIKSGSTPKTRHISKSDINAIRWLTPTNCSDYGYIQNIEYIATPDKPNLTEDASLLINRTSRGGKGEYVGICTFYDFNSYGIGHHNQGIYRVQGYDKKQLVFITCFMNSPIMRKYCAAICVGSKMKEIKSGQFTEIPIPKFREEQLNRIYNLFYTENFSYDINNILSTQAQTIGLMQLSIAKTHLEKHLNHALDLICDNIDIKPLITTHPTI